MSEKLITEKDVTWQQSEQAVKMPRAVNDCIFGIICSWQVPPLI